MKRVSFRRLLAENKPLVTPSAHDALSARLIEQAGFKAIALGGLSLLAAQHGIPDIGLASLSDMTECARAVLRATSLPCGIDGDDGYGDVKSVVRTVRAYEALGLGSIIFEDQVMGGKRPGDSAAAAVVPIAVMVEKVRAAVASRSDPETLILARTDALKIESMDGALARAECYLAAGADGIFISGIDDFSSLRFAGERLRGAIQLAVVTERLLATAPTPAELFAMGYGQVVFPHYLILRVTAVMQTALAELSQIATGQRAASSVARHPEMSDALQKIVGIADWKSIETKFRPS
jgi:2-methylisocitrate lyase-like PEP mutase family enzyme